MGNTKITNKHYADGYIAVILATFIMCFLTITDAVATTEFFLLPNDIDREIHCSYLEIKNKQALCTENNLLITYNLAQIRNIEVIDDAKVFRYKRITWRAAERINNLNSEKINPEKAKKAIKEKRTKSSSSLFDLQQLSSCNSFCDYRRYIQSVISKYRIDIGNNWLYSLLLLTGFIIFLIGSFQFIRTAFRENIFWGLGCLIFPFISIIFLFVHRQTAARPFFLLLFGLAISLSSVLITPTTKVLHNLTGSRHFSTKINKGNFRCRGKIYCSEMSSCAEARFYLSNCPGTKIDGDNDGIPCEKQWCGH